VSADLRARIAEALRSWYHNAGGTDAVMAEVQAELDAQDAQLAAQAEAMAELDDKATQAYEDRDEAVHRAEQAEALADEHAANARELGERLRQAEAERDQLRAAVEQTDELLGAITLYISWRYVTRNLRTDQKELFADAVERFENRMHGPDGEDPDPEMAGLPSYTPRWWRDDAALDQAPAADSPYATGGIVPGPASSSDQPSSEATR
jgi:uncharacterized membrane-anchored protein YhcB (DUF1043 family)